MRLFAAFAIKNIIMINEFELNKHENIIITFLLHAGSRDFYASMNAWIIK